MLFCTFHARGHSQGNITGTFACAYQVAGGFIEVDNLQRNLCIVRPAVRQVHLQTPTGTRADDGA